MLQNYASKKYLLVTADTNDADYVTDVTEINNEDLIRVKKIFSMLPKKKRHNWPDHDDYQKGNIFDKYKKLTEEDFDFINGYIPHGEYGIHTIESVRVLEVISDETII